MDSMNIYLLQVIGMITKSISNMKTEIDHMIPPIVQFGYMRKLITQQLQEDQIVLEGVKCLLQLYPQTSLEFFDRRALFPSFKDFHYTFPLSNVKNQEYVISKFSECVTVLKFSVVNQQTLGRALIGYCKDITLMINIASIAYEHNLWSPDFDEIVFKFLRGKGIELIPPMTCPKLKSDFISPHLDKLLDCTPLKILFRKEIQEIIIELIMIDSSRVIICLYEHPDILDITQLQLLLSLAQSSTLQMSFKKILMIWIDHCDSDSLPSYDCVKTLLLINFNTILVSLTDITLMVVLSLLQNFKQTLIDDAWLMILDFSCTDILQELKVTIARKITLSLDCLLSDLKSLQKQIDNKYDNADACELSIDIIVEFIKQQNVDESYIESLVQFLYDDMKLIDHRFKTISEIIFSMLIPTGPVSPPDIFENLKCQKALQISKDSLQSDYLSQLTGNILKLISQMKERTLTMREVELYLVNKPQLMESMMKIVDPDIDFEFLFGYLQTSITQYKKTTEMYNSIVHFAESHGKVFMPIIKQKLLLIEQNYQSTKALDILTGALWTNIKISDTKLQSLESYGHFRHSLLFANFLEQTELVQQCEQVVLNQHKQNEELSKLIQFDSESMLRIFNVLKDNIFKKFGRITQSRIDNMLNDESQLQLLELVHQRANKWKELDHEFLHKLFKNIPSQQIQQELDLVEVYMSQSNKNGFKLTDELRLNVQSYSEMQSTQHNTNLVLKLTEYFPKDLKDEMIDQLGQYNIFLSERLEPSTKIMVIHTQVQTIKKVVSSVISVLNDYSYAEVHLCVNMFTFYKSYGCTLDLTRLHLDLEESALTFEQATQCQNAFNLMYLIKQKFQGISTYTFIGSLKILAVLFQERMKAQTSLRSDLKASATMLPQLQQIVRDIQALSQIDIKQEIQSLMESGQVQWIHNGEHDFYIHQSNHKFFDYDINQGNVILGIYSKQLRRIYSHSCILDNQTPSSLLTKFKYVLSECSIISSIMNQSDGFTNPIHKSVIDLSSADFIQQLTDLKVKFTNSNIDLRRKDYYFLHFLSTKQAIKLYQSVSNRQIDEVYKIIQTSFIDDKLLDRKLTHQLLSLMMKEQVDNALQRFQKLFDQQDQVDLQESNLNLTTIIPGQISLSRGKGKVQYRYVSNDISHYTAILNLYTAAKYQPRSQDVFLCSKSTQFDQIQTFILRAFRYNNNCDNERLFCIGNFQTMHQNLQSQVYEFIAEQESLSNDQFCLYILAVLQQSNDTKERFQVLKFQNEKHQKEIERAWHTKLDYVKVYQSENSGLGKTQAIKAMEQETSEGQFKIIRIPICGSIDRDQLIQIHIQELANFQKHKKNALMKIRLGFHYDIDMVSSLEDLNQFLFSLVVLRQIQSESGVSYFSFPDQFITPVYLFIELSSNLNSVYDKLVLIHFPSIIINYSMSTINIKQLLPLGLNRVCRYLRALFNLYSYHPEINIQPVGRNTRQVIDAPAEEQEKYDTIFRTEKEVMEMKETIDIYVAPHIKDFNYRTLRAFITMMDSQIQQLDQCPHINLHPNQSHLSQTQALMLSYFTQAQKSQQLLQIRDVHKEVLQCLYTLTLRLCNQGNTEDSIKYLLSQPLLCFYEDSELITGVTSVNQLNDILKDHLFATSNPFFLCAALKSLSYEQLYLFLCAEANQCPNAKKYFKVLNDPILQPTAIDKWWQYLLIYLKLKGCRQSVIISTNSPAQVFKNVHLMSNLIAVDCIKIQIDSIVDSSKIVAILERYTHHSQTKATLVQVTDLCPGATSYSLIKDIFLEKLLQGYKIPDSLLFIWLVQNSSPLLEYVSLRSFTLSFKCNTDNDDEYSVNIKVKGQLAQLFPGEESKYQDLRLEQLLNKVHSFKKKQATDADQSNSNNMMVTLMVDNFFLIFIYFNRSMLGQQDISKIRDKSIFNAAIYQALKESYGTKFTQKEMKEFEILLSQHPGLMDFQVRQKLKQYHERFLVSVQQEVKQKNIVWNQSLIDTIMTVHTFIELKYPQILYTEPGSGLGKSLLFDILTQFYKGRKAVIRYSGLMDLSYQDFIVMVEKAINLQQEKIKHDVILVLDDFNYTSIESFNQNGGPQIMNRFKSERFPITIVFLTSQKQFLPKRGIPQIRFKQEHNKKDIQAVININQQSLVGAIREEMTAIFDWYMALKNKKQKSVDDEDNKLFGLRDLYQMQDYIIQNYQIMSTDTSNKIISDAFLSYFGGIGLNYINCLPQMISSFQNEAHFLLQRNSLIENRNNRHVLLICNEEDYVQALQLIQLVYADVPYDLFLGSDHEDSTERLQELHDNLTLRVKIGRLCVLVGSTDAINILFDIIDRPVQHNQYQKFITRNMMHGALTTRVRPHQNFKCIFVITRSQLRNINSSVISRFEKIIIRNEPKVIDYRSERQIFSQLKEFVDFLEVDSSLFARDIKDNVFILQVVKDVLKQDYKLNILAQQCKSRIIQLATFKGIIQIQNQLSNINDNWLKEYIENNEHFNIKDTLINSDNHPRLQIYTYSSLSEIKMVIADELKVTYIDLISYTLSPLHLRHQIVNYFEDQDKSQVLIIYANQKSNQLGLSRWLVDRIDGKVVAIILQMNIEVYSNCDYANGWKNLTIELADGQGTSELSIKDVVASHPIDLFQRCLNQKKLQVFQRHSLSIHSTNLHNFMHSVINKQEWADKLLKVKLITDCSLQLDPWPLGSLSSYKSTKDNKSQCYLDIMIQEVLTPKIQEAICSINNFLEDEGLLLLHSIDPNKFDQMMLLSESLFSDVCLYNSHSQDHVPGSFTYFRAVQIRFCNLRKQLLNRQDNNIDQAINRLQDKYISLYDISDGILEIDNNSFLGQFITSLVQKEPEEQNNKKYQQFIEAAFKHIMKESFESKVQLYAVYWEYEDILAKSWVLINQTAGFELDRYLKFLELHINDNIISTLKYTPVHTFIECLIISLCDIFLPSYEFFNEYDIWLDFIKDALPLLSTFVASEYPKSFIQIKGLAFIQGFIRNAFGFGQSKLEKIHRDALSVEFACQFMTINNQPGDVIALVYQTIDMLIPTDARAMESQVMEPIGCYLAQCSGCGELEYYLSYLQDERNKLRNDLQPNAVAIIALLVQETDQRFYQSVINSTNIDQMHVILSQNNLYRIINDFLIGEPLIPAIKPLDFKDIDKARPFTLSDTFVHSIIDVFEHHFREKSLFADDQSMLNTAKITIVKRKECNVHHLLSIAYFRYRALQKFNVQNEESLLHLERNDQYEAVEIQALFSKIINFHVIEKRRIMVLPREVVVSWPVINQLKKEKISKKKKGQNKQKQVLGKGHNLKKKTSSDDECV